VDVPLERQRRARMAQVVEGYLWQTCTLQERCKGSLTEVGGVGGVDEAAGLAREYEALILVETDP
jgi:hypothetical protein